MSEKILRALMRLFAIIAKSDDNSSEARGIVHSYLKQQLNKEQVDEYLNIYDEYLTKKGDNIQAGYKYRNILISIIKRHEGEVGINNLLNMSGIKIKQKVGRKIKQSNLKTTN